MKEKQCVMALLWPVIPTPRSFWDIFLAQPIKNSKFFGQDFLQLFTILVSVKVCDDPCDFVLKSDVIIRQREVIHVYDVIKSVSCCITGFQCTD